MYIVAYDLYKRHGCSIAVQVSRAGIISMAIRLICPIVRQSGIVERWKSMILIVTSPVFTYHFVRPKTPIWISAMDCQSLPTSTLFRWFLCFLLANLCYALPLKDRIFTSHNSPTSLSNNDSFGSFKHNKQTVHTLTHAQTHTKLIFFIFCDLSLSLARSRFLFAAVVDDSVFATTVLLLLERVHCAANKIKNWLVHSRRDHWQYTFPQQRKLIFAPKIWKIFQLNQFEKLKQISFFCFNFSLLYFYFVCGYFIVLFRIRRERTTMWQPLLAGKYGWLDSTIPLTQLSMKTAPPRIKFVDASELMWSVRCTMYDVV